jgi:thiamine kinase-like enzyme
MHRFDRVADLSCREILSKLTGPIVKIDTEPLSANGFSGSVLERVHVLLQTGATKKFILKKTNLRADWLSQRSNDHIGREAAFLNESRLSRIWDIIHCPYVAFAREHGSTGLLMDDYSDYLFPDVREPLDKTAEDIIIDVIARLHAQFWNSDEIRKLQWLAQPYDYLHMLSQRADGQYPPPEKLGNSIVEGWKIALRVLPPRLRNYLTKPVEEIFRPWKNLPLTLLHGDVKVANMAIIPNGKLVLFDWPMIGCAPCGIELGWYLAVNSTRLATTKEEFIGKYKTSLETHLQFTIEKNMWQRILHLAVIAGAMMLLWNKALAMKSGSQKSIQEWEWWKDQLEAATNYDTNGQNK